MAGFITRPVVTGRKGVVTSGHYLATAAGFRIMENGGNAIDAAAGMCIAVDLMEPQSCGIGGEVPYTHLLRRGGQSVLHQRSGLVAAGVHGRMVQRERHRPHTGGRVPADHGTGGRGHMGRGRRAMGDEELLGDTRADHRPGGERVRAVRGPLEQPRGRPAKVHGALPVDRRGLPAERGSPRGRRPCTQSRLRRDAADHVSRGRCRQGEGPA